MWLPIPQKKMPAIDILCSPFNHHALGKTGSTPFPHSHWQIVMSCRYFQGWEIKCPKHDRNRTGNKIIGTCLFRSLSFSFLPKGAGAALSSFGNGFGIYSWKAPGFIILIFPLGCCLHLQCCWCWIKTPSSWMGLTLPPSFSIQWVSSNVCKKYIFTLTHLLWSFNYRLWSRTDLEFPLQRWRLQSGRLFLPYKGQQGQKIQAFSISSQRREDKKALEKSPITGAPV